VSDEGRGRQIYQDQNGSSAVEFAIVGPIFIILVIGVIAFGYAIYGVVTVRYALEQTSRVLQLNSSMTKDQLTTILANKITGLGDPNVTLSLSIDPQVGDEKLAHLAVTYTFNVNIPLLPTYSIDYQSAVTVPLAMS
jgi:Flp pilus assembly protein TadG